MGLIELYAKGATDFSRHGIALAADSASVTFQDNGRYDMDMTMPYNAAINIDYGMILRCPVPVQDVAAIVLGTVSYWQVKSGVSEVNLYSQIPTIHRVSYKPWLSPLNMGTEVMYHAGDKVTYNGNNYQCLAYDPNSDKVMFPPPANTEWWQRISNTAGSTGKIAATLHAGDRIVRTGDYSDEYMKAADTAGHEGFIEIAKCDDLSETDTRTVPAQHIEKQSFTITEITKSSDGRKLSLHAEHISYALGRVMLGDCNISRANPATALMFIRGAMQENYPGEVETNLTDADALITGDFSWKNAQAAILDPKAGFLQATGARLIRNDMNVYVIREEEADPRYRITYGTNMKAVKWDGNINDLVTRIYPIAQTEDGSTLLLPEKYIDSVRAVPYVRPEALNTRLKVGAKEKQEDGSEITLDQDTVYARMREAVSNRFNVDECDKAVITLDVDWQHLPDTEEYGPYSALRNAAPGEWVKVENAPLGIRISIQMTGYTYDPITMRYTKGTFGRKKQSPGVASYDLKSGAVTGRAIGAGAVGSQNIQAGSITAREIEAGSITADRIASKSIQTDLLAAGSVTADEILAGSVTAEKIAAYAITAEKIAAGAITAQAIASEVITTRHLAAGAVVADKIAAGAVEASKIAALAITAEKIAAGAVTAEKIAAGSISAGKIDTNDLQAINAKLGTATIANGYINNADIDYARVKDAAIGTAIIDTSITESGTADRLFINRLMITYGQMVQATIGDLVIGDSNGNYYHIDVSWDEYGVPSLVPALVDTPSAEEIASGHTSDGKTIIGDVGTYAELSSEDFYAINGIIDRITAKRIDVDELWARQAFIGKLMTTDISSNTYIQATIGNWASGSTITQTINSINTRITSLGYGTFYYSMTEPSHENLVQSDVWIQPIADTTWDDIEELTWDNIDDMTWDDLEGKYKMYVWTGEKFQLMFNNIAVSQMQTAIEQNAYAITLKADAADVTALGETVATFGATLEVQAAAITAAVSSVNAKTANYPQLSDPADDPDITLSTGDIWTKTCGGSWDFIESLTWNQLEQLTWDELAGPRTYVWSGTDWVLVSDGGAQITNRTMIEQTDKQITIMAEEQVLIGDQVSRNTASITIVADRITQEVERATNAENGKISKTTQYQTADSIVTEAINQAASSASGLYLAKTTAYQTPDSIVTEAVQQSANAAEGAYLKKTSTYQTADEIVSAAQTYTNGQLASYSTISQTSTAIESYVRDNAYKIQSGIAIEAAGVTISGGKYVNIQSSGSFSVTASTFGIRSAANETYAIWAGNGTAAAAPFRVKPDGTVYLTKLIAVSEQGAETEVNLRTAGLWKLSYHTIKEYTITDGYCSSMKLSNGATVNFKTAASARADGWSAAYNKVSWPSWSQSAGYDITFKAPTGSESDTPNYAERTYSLQRNGAYINLINGGLVFARYPAYSQSPSWTHSLVTAHVMNVTCTVDGYTYSTQFSV